MADELAPKKELGRELGLLSVFNIATGTMVGAGVFVLPGLAVDLLVPTALLTFLLASPVAFTTGLRARAGHGHAQGRGNLPLPGPAPGTHHRLHRRLGTWTLSIPKGAFAAVGFAPYPELLVDVPPAVAALLLALLPLGSTWWRSSIGGCSGPWSSAWSRWGWPFSRSSAWGSHGAARWEPVGRECF